MTRVKNHSDHRAKAEGKVSQLSIELERLRSENVRLRRNQRERDTDHMLSHVDSREALELESSASSTKIELLKEEIAEWKDRVRSQRNLELEKKELESMCKQLEMKLHVAEEQNRILSRRVTQLMNETANVKKQPSNEPSVRAMMDKFAKEREIEMSAWRDRHGTLLKQYRSLEDAFRDLQHAREVERREFYHRQQTGQLRIQDQPRLIDDGASFDSRAWESSSYAESGRTSPESSDRGMTRHEGNADPANMPVIPMVQNGAPQLRPSASATSDSHNPFTALIPRRGTNSSGKSDRDKPTKIKPNSEIRIYGRYTTRVVCY